MAANLIANGIKKLFICKTIIFLNFNTSPINIQIRSHSSYEICVPYYCLNAFLLEVIIYCEFVFD